MKEDINSKTPSIQNRKAKQHRKSSDKYIQGLESYESEKLQDAIESSIAQEQAIFSELRIQQEFKQKKKQRLVDSLNHSKQPPQNLLNKFNCDNSYDNSRLLLGQSISSRTQIISIAEIKRYEEKAKYRNQGYKFPEKLDLSLKVNESSANKNEKSTKKSLSSKIAKQKGQSLQQKPVKSNRSEVQNGFKQNRNSLDLQSIKSLNEIPLSKSPSSKNIPNSVSQNLLYPMTVPFSFTNINTAINSLQNLEIESNSSISQRGNQKGNRLNSKKKNSENKLFKQLNSTKYMIDVPMDMNEFSYQLDMELNIDKNRGIQLYLISPQTRLDGTYFEEVMHFKYQIVKLPPNILRLRLYLLIESQQNPNYSNSNRKKSQSPQKSYQMGQSYVNQTVYRQWKIWKEIHVPIMINGQKIDHQIIKRIKLSVLSMQLGWVQVRINSTIEFNIRLNHLQVPVCYYCIDQDFNGVELMKLSLSGREKIKLAQDFIGEGCQGKCQLI